MTKNTKDLINFLKEIEKLKLIDRQTYLSSLKRENDAEHSWHVAMFIILFEKDFEGYDVERMLKMALIHDLVEIYAGDTFSFDNHARINKKAKEEKAAKKLFNKLPIKLRKIFFELFNEYESKESKEAKLVQSFDKIQPILQGIVSHGKMWKERNITYSHIDDYKKDYLINNNKILDIYKSLLNEALKKKYLTK